LSVVAIFVVSCWETQLHFVCGQARGIVAILATKCHTCCYLREWIKLFCCFLKVFFWVQSNSNFIHSMELGIHSILVVKLLT
jgi:hypothetical protein